MSIMELANAPIVINLGGKQFKIQTLSVKEFFGESQSKVVQNYLKSVQEIASVLTGKDKIDYLVTATKNIPTGDVLYQEAMAYLGTPLGLADLLKLGLNKCQKVSEDEITECLYKATDEERQILMAYLSGSYAAKDKAANNEAVIVDSDKKK